MTRAIRLEWNGGRACLGCGAGRATLLELFATCPTNGYPAWSVWFDGEALAHGKADSINAAKLAAEACARQLLRDALKELGGEDE